MARIELSQLIAEMTVEQKILMQWFYSQFDNRSAANRRITNVEPIFYFGSYAAMPTNTYNANIAYIVLSLTMSGTALLGANVPLVRLYNQAGAIFFYGALVNETGDGTAIKKNFTLQNFYCYRIALANGPTNISLIGYRINLI